MTQIKFGTDGWRAEMDNDFNLKNVTRVTQAFCDMHHESTNKLVFVGFDRRKMSHAAAKLVAQILLYNKFDPKISSQFCPTPAISWLVKQNKALAGIVITASHNPAHWNGYKIKDVGGIPASPEYTKKLEAHILPEGVSDFESVDMSSRVFDPHATYGIHLTKMIDLEKIKACGFKIVVDPLFGAGTGFIKNYLPDQVHEIHAEADYNFGGLHPEPIDKNLTELFKMVKQTKADIGLATDGDADRLGACDFTGTFVNSHQLFGLLLLHHLRHRKQTGAIIKSLSTTNLINRICEKHSLPCFETPIGFKHIAGELVKHNALMGGEESGGISWREHVHERDGIMNALLVLEMMAVNQKSLAQLVQDMYLEFGAFYYDRHDYFLTQPKKEAAYALALKMAFDKIGDIKVNSFGTKDGIKANLADGSWLLIRTSGTEPLLRVYAEASTPTRVNEILSFAKKYLGL